MADFNKLGAEVVGVSGDDAKTLLDFQTKDKVPQTFVSDPDFKTIAAYDVKQKLGKTQFAKRTTFVIGRDGKILYSVFDWSPLANVNKVYQWLKAHPQS